MYLHVFLFAITFLGSASAFKDGRILTFDENIGEFDEFQTHPSEYQYMKPGQGPGDAEVATVTGVDDSDGASLSTPDRMLALLRDRYVRTPIAVVVDTEPASLRQTQRLWRETLKDVDDDQVQLVLLPYNATGMGPVFKTKGIPWFQQVLKSVPAVPTPPHTTGGVAFYSVLKATEQTPFDSAIWLFTGRQPVDEYLAQLTAATLVQKRTKLHVVWFGGQSSSSVGSRGADLLYREMTSSTGGVFVVADESIDVTTDVVDAAVDVHPAPTRKPTREAEMPELEVEAPDREENESNTRHEVLVALRQDITGTVTTPVYVDSTIHGLRVTINGPISVASLRQPSGIPIDLLSEAALRRWSSGGARVMHKSDALLDLQLNTSAVPPGVWELVTTSRDVEGLAGSYNVTVTAFSKLSFTASLWSVGLKDRMDAASSNASTQLRLTMTGVGSIARITLLNEQGKELRQLSYQRRDGVDDTDPNDQITTDVNMPGDIEMPSTMFVKLSGQDPTGAEFTRVSPVSLERQTLAPYPGATGINEAVTIDVAANSTLYIQPNQYGQIIFQVTNNRKAAILYRFNVRNDQGIVQSIIPKEAYIGPQLTYDVVVRIVIPPTVVQGTTSTVTLTAQAQFEQLVKKSALITVGEKVWDPERPYIWHSLKVNCRAHTEPNVCYTRVWNVEVHIEDRHSGLLYVKSSPRGIYFNSDWVAGTKTAIVGYYSASCCENKVDILAMDVNGQYITYALDADDTWIGLSPTEISTIVLGSLLLIVLIILIILAICLCRRNSKRSHDLPVHPRSTRH